MADTAGRAANAKAWGNLDGDGGCDCMRAVIGLGGVAGTTERTKGDGCTVGSVFVVLGKVAGVARWKKPE